MPWMHFTWRLHRPRYSYELTTFALSRRGNFSSKIFWHPGKFISILLKFFEIMFGSPQGSASNQAKSPTRFINPKIFKIRFLRFFQDLEIFQDFQIFTEFFKVRKLIWSRPIKHSLWPSFTMSVWWFELIELPTQNLTLMTVIFSFLHLKN